jgi:hypothetical protein
MSATIDADQMGVAGYQDITSNTATRLHCDAAGRLDVNVLGNEVGDGSGTPRHLHLDGNGNVHTSVVNTVNINPANEVNSEVQDDPSSSVCVTLKGRTAINDKTTGKHLKCNTDGHLQVDIPATTGIKIEDVSSTLDADHANNSRSLPMTMKGRTNISDHTTGTYLLTDAAGHLQVDVVSGGGGGDASAANQTTAIGHLSEIEGAVETLEACVSGNKVAVELSAGDINIGNVDVVSAAGITQLPASLGQKANASSLSVCRSSTAGAYDLSARTTIGSAGTTTRLACSTAGHLFVKTAQNTSNGGGTNTATIAVGALGHAQSLSADNTFANVFLMVDTADSGNVEDVMVMVARQNTATSDYFVHTKVIPTGGTAGPTDVEWVALTNTTRYYAHVHIRKPPEYIAIYNAGTGDNKIAVLYNYGLE